MKKLGFAPLDKNKFKNMGVKNKSYLTGFTIIEFLVAVSIIALLVTGAVYYTLKAMQKGRDNRRKVDLLLISDALDKYYDLNRVYPGDINGCGGHSLNYDSTCPVGANQKNWIPNLESFLNPMPLERGPKVGDFVVIDKPCDFGSNDLRVYQYEINGNSPSHFMLAARLELEDINDQNVVNKTLCGADDYRGNTGFQKNITGYPIYIIYR